MKINRRRFSITIVLGAIGAFLFDAFWLETYMINWTSFDISEKSDDEKIKVVQLTDMHMTKLQPYHRTLIKRTNQENPDIIFITGDAINENKNLPELDEFLSLLNPEIQKIFILGNKEYWGNVNIPEFKLLCEKYNGTLLVNENTTVTIKNRTLTVIGVDDFVGGNADFGKAAEKV